MKLKQFIRDDAALLKRQQEQKKFRDNTWVTNARPLTESIFREAARYLKESDHLFNAWVEKATPSESEELVMLKLGPHKLPVENEGRPWVLEKGACLSVSKQPEGRVIVVLYPYSSEVRYHRQKEFMLSGPIEPILLTEARLHRYLKDLLFLANVTSLKAGAGSLVSGTFFKMRWLILKDFRNRQDLIIASSMAALTQVRGMVIGAVFGSILTSLAWLIGID